MPARVSIDNLREGMVAAQPVTDRSGRTLAAQGERLDAKILARMRAAGVLFADVAEGIDPALGEDPLAAQVETVLARKFQGTEDNPVMNEIRALAKEQLLARRRVPS